MREWPGVIDFRSPKQLVNTSAMLLSMNDDGHRHRPGTQAWRRFPPKLRTLVAKEPSSAECKQPVGDRTVTKEVGQLPAEERKKGCAYR
jgi:hypothetical protein